MKKKYRNSFINLSFFGRRKSENLERIMSKRKNKNWNFNKRTCNKCDRITETIEQGNIKCKYCDSLIEVYKKLSDRFNDIEMRRSIMENAPPAVKKMWEEAEEADRKRENNYQKEYYKRPEVRKKLFERKILKKKK